MRRRLTSAIAAAAVALLVAGCLGSGHSTAPPSATVGDARGASPQPGLRQPGLAQPGLPQQPLPQQGLPLPPSFFGLSIEWMELPEYERFLPAFARILRLWRVTGDGPQVIRIGGDSSDVTYWQPGRIARPPGAFLLTPGFFEQAAELIRQADLRVILDLNLRNSLPALEAGLAREAEATLPHGSIIGFQVGNEPDRYHAGYTPKTYSVLLRAYAAALAPVAPGVAILGPAVTNVNANLGWLRDVARDSGSAVTELDGHRYMLGGKDSPRTRFYPTIARMLSTRMTRGLAESVRPAILLANRFHKPFRLDELGSANSGGRAGVSNTFATALWAPDALFSLWAVGLQALNMHIRTHRINGPLELTRHGFVARPLFYGMALFARTVSPDARLLPLRVHAAPVYHLSAWAVRVATGAVHVLLMDKGGVAANVRLTLGTSGPVEVERMLAPSVAATRGVTLAGQRLARNGRLVGRFRVETVLPHNGVDTIHVPAGSAALVIAPVPGARSHSSQG